MYLFTAYIIINLVKTGISKSVEIIFNTIQYLLINLNLFRMRNIFSFGLLTLFLLFQANNLFSQKSNIQEWNQFRGPHKNGALLEEKLADNWSVTTPKLVWKEKIGAAFSEIVVSGDKIYTMTSEKTDSVSGLEFIVCLDTETGKEIWKTHVDSMFYDPDKFGDGSRATPAVDENTIFSFSARGNLTACSKKDGKISWQIDVKKEFGSKLPLRGYSSSPLLLNDMLIMEIGGTENRAFVAFDKSDGKIIWSNGSGNPFYNSPTLVTINGKETIIFANGRKLYAYDTKGDTIWSAVSKTPSSTATPVFFESNKFFLSNLRSFSVVEVTNNVAKEILSGNSMKNDFSSSVYHNGYLYGFNIAALQCIDAKTGEKTWAKRGFGKGSLILVNNTLVVLSDKGKLILAKATPDTYTELSSIQAIKGKSWTAPSFTNAKVYVRNQSEIACFSFN